MSNANDPSWSWRLIIWWYLAKQIIIHSTPRVTVNVERMHTPRSLSRSQTGHPQYLRLPWEAGAILQLSPDPDPAWATRTHVSGVTTNTFRPRRVGRMSIPSLSNACPSPLELSVHRVAALPEARAGYRSCFQLVSSHLILVFSSTHKQAFVILTHAEATPRSLGTNTACRRAINSETTDATASGSLTSPSPLCHWDQAPNVPVS
ncbi:hypothetical protein R3P38DRAFT_3242671 [Favolaschia claudopus]|uniref:Uncharacterized protein n=1 Tax=Favolaschia claudopus TaxID=2862362 RepID=A0AAV9Z4E0_9AGAR